MIGTLLIAIPGYGMALWGALGWLVLAVDCYRAARKGGNDAALKGAMLGAAGSALVALFFGGITRWLLGGAL